MSQKKDLNMATFSGKMFNFQVFLSYGNPVKCIISNDYVPYQCIIAILHGKEVVGCPWCQNDIKLFLNLPDHAPHSMICNTVPHPLYMGTFTSGYSS